MDKVTNERGKKTNNGIRGHLKEGTEERISNETIELKKK